MGTNLITALLRRIQLAASAICSLHGRRRGARGLRDAMPTRRAGHAHVRATPMTNHRDEFLRNAAPTLQRRGRDRAAALLVRPAVTPRPRSGHRIAPGLRLREPNSCLNQRVVGMRATGQPGGPGLVNPRAEVAGRGSHRRAAERALAREARPEAGVCADSGRGIRRYDTSTRGQRLCDKQQGCWAGVSCLFGVTCCCTLAQGCGVGQPVPD